MLLLEDNDFVCARIWRQTVNSDGSLNKPEQRDSCRDYSMEARRQSGSSESSLLPDYSVIPRSQCYAAACTLGIRQVCFFLALYGSWGVVSRRANLRQFTRI